MPPRFGESDSNRVWSNPGLPQTLRIAHILMYLRGGMGLLQAVVFGSGLTGLLFGFPLFWLLYWLITVPGQIAAAFGIANEKKWGYRLGVASAAAPLCLRLLNAVLLLAMARSFNFLGLLTRDPISLMFDIALLALLLHNHSREYVGDRFE